MRLRAILFAAIVLAGAGAAAYKLAGAATAWYERTTAGEIGAALKAAGQDWATVALDGLRVTLAGAAPDETSRFKALEIARQAVDPGRIADTTTVQVRAPLPPPPFALELLRNEADISLIGLVPETGGRDVIRAALGAGGLSGHVTDMLESAAEPAPEGWREALGFGLSVLAELPRAKISVAPGKVKVIAVADTDPDRARLEARLKRAAPQGITLALDVSAPRPVIAPFAFAFSLEHGSGTLTACSADSAEAAAGILAAAHAAGLADDPECAVGLGAPSPDWAAAVARGLEALRALGGGRFALTDLAAELTVPPGAPTETVNQVSAALDAGLPDVFQLTTKVPPHMEARDDGAEVYPPRFDAVLDADGTVRLSGPVQDATSRGAILSYAASLFGHDRITDATVVGPGLPEGWPGRVLAGVEALATLKEGKLRVTPEQVAVAGWGIEPDVNARVEALLAQKGIGAGAVVHVTYNAEAAAEAEDAARPRPEICADQISAILAAGSIRFGAGSADIVPESRGVIAAIADVLRGCPGADFEIGGHTDSQGSPEANRQLSEDRAQAVLAALEAENLPLVHLTARGFGADDPVADNTTRAGRASNRRIEFTLAAPEDASGELVADPEGAAAAGGEPGPESDAGAAESAADAGAAAATQCAAKIDAALTAGPIEFEPGSASILPKSAPVVAAIATALRGCPDAGFEIGGYTDAQGSEAGNLSLSQARAEAVAAALRAPDLPLPGLTAHGYGEADPIADNATSAGRAQNRRIVFKPATAAPPAAGAQSGDAVAPEAEATSTAAQDPDAACATRIEDILSAGSIQFAAGSDRIAPESAPVIGAIAAALRGCPDVVLEVGAYTDAEGSERGNLRLSQTRAEAVVAALRAPDLPLPGLTAHGYGEADPIADNGTAAGRAQNRRIEFQPATAEGDGSGDGSE